MTNPKPIDADTIPNTYVLNGPRFLDIVLTWLDPTPDGAITQDECPHVADRLKQCNRHEFGQAPYNGPLIAKSDVVAELEAVIADYEQRVTEKDGYCQQLKKDRDNASDVYVKQHLRREVDEAQKDLADLKSHPTPAYGVLKKITEAKN